MKGEKLLLLLAPDFRSLLTGEESCCDRLSRFLEIGTGAAAAAADSLGSSNPAIAAG